VDLEARLRKHKSDLLTAAKLSNFIVFLCGPSLRSRRPAAKLRRSIIAQLKSEGFDVVLGEDDGLEDARLQVGVNAQDNELEFIRNHCNAVILVADSIGSFCELGLFSWHYAHSEGLIRKGTGADFILIADAKYRKNKSYFNEGPVKSVHAFGHVSFVDYRSCNWDDVLDRLKARRATFTLDHRRRGNRGK
jgi:hypothetical protein